MKDRFKVKVVPNKSLTYMLPLVDSELNLDFRTHLLNSYVSFDKGDKVYSLLYKWSADKGYLKYEDRLLNHHMSRGHKDLGDMVIYKFKLTPEMELARELFLEGKVKDFSDSHKQQILDYLKKAGFNNGARIAKILDKDNSILSAPPLLETEVVMNSVEEIIIQMKNPWIDESN